jgi:hypothetical protein
MKAVERDALSLEDSNEPAGDNVRGGKFFENNS